MTITRPTKIILTVLAIIGFAFIWIPLAVIVVNSFNAGQSLAFPPVGFSTRWWEAAFSNSGIR